MRRENLLLFASVCSVFASPTVDRGKGKVGFSPSFAQDCRKTAELFLKRQAPRTAQMPEERTTNARIDQFTLLPFTFYVQSGVYTEVPKEGGSQDVYVKVPVSERFGQCRLTLNLIIRDDTGNFEGLEAWASRLKEEAAASEPHTLLRDLDDEPLSSHSPGFRTYGGDVYDHVDAIVTGLQQAGFMNETRNRRHGETWLELYMKVSFDASQRESEHRFPTIRAPDKRKEQKSRWTKFSDGVKGVSRKVSNRMKQVFPGLDKEFMQHVELQRAHDREQRRLWDLAEKKYQEDYERAMQESLRDTA